MDAEKEPPKDPPPEAKPPKFQTEGPPVLLPCKSQEGIKLGVTKNTLKLFPRIVNKLGRIVSHFLSQSDFIDDGTFYQPN